MNALSVEPDTPDLDDIPDMEEEGLEEVADEATAKPTPAAPAEVAKGNLLQVRTYDVMITYDKYYQTPRIWLLGFDEVRHLLHIIFFILTPCRTEHLLLLHKSSKMSLRIMRSRQSPSNPSPT